MSSPPRRDKLVRVIFALVGIPLLVIVLLAVAQSILFDFTALVSRGWVGVLVLIGWLVGFPIFAWWVSRNEPPRF